MTEPSEHKPIIGITHGDFNGIGYEVIIKALNDPRILEMLTPVVYGSSKVASYHRKAIKGADFNFNLVKKADLVVHKRANIINCFEDEVKIELGKSSEVAGKMAFLALEHATADLNAGLIDALVTAPINKHNIRSESFQFEGHTEYLANKYGVTDYLMLMVSRYLRVGVITGHIPIGKVASTISKELIINKLRILHKSLIEDFGINKPRIAVLGLNPHAGDNGIIGDEENEVIIPAIEAVRNAQMLAYGPYPADGFFGSSGYRGFDAVLAMYHDQGMLPFKTLSFDEGVNFTAGLPHIRTSPAHGTGYDIAGKDEASPDSFREAMLLALDLVRNRKAYKELTSNPLPLSTDNTHKSENPIN